MSSSSNQVDRSSVLRIQAESLYAERWRVEVPVMRETLLLLELETQESCVDLGAFSQQILGDLGATLQVLRLAGREFGRSGGCPSRIEDCVAALGIQACLDAVSLQLMPIGRHSKPIAQFWRHSREIARLAKHIAEQTSEMDADKAYLVGLCHSIGSLPGVLGWSGSKGRKLDSIASGVELAKEWSLPGCVVDYFRDMQHGGGRSAWPEIVQTAHQCGNEHSGVCPSSEELAPQMLWAV